MWFTGLYIYFAVPSYAMALGLFAGALTETLEKRKMEAMLSKRLTANEFSCAPKCRHGGEPGNATAFIEDIIQRRGPSRGDGAHSSTLVLRKTESGGQQSGPG